MSSSSVACRVDVHLAGPARRRKQGADRGRVQKCTAPQLPSEPCASTHVVYMSAAGRKAGSGLNRRLERAGATQHLFDFRDVVALVANETPRVLFEAHVFALHQTEKFFVDSQSSAFVPEGLS